METVAVLLAREFTLMGHEVTVLTDTLGHSGLEELQELDVVRNPSLREKLSTFRKCDVVLLHGLSAKYGLAAVAAGSPYMMSHHIWRRGIQSGVGIGRFRFAMDQALIRRASLNVSVSHAIKQDIGGVGVVAGNPYDERVFSRAINSERDPESIIFVGRLVPGKGPQQLIEAVQLLRAEGRDTCLTIVGDGPQRQELEHSAEETAGKVRVVGPMLGETLAAEMGRHKVLAVPSIWDEPFGVVALEGAAVGCVVVGSEGGGLSEAIGPCGVTYPNGSLTGLVGALATGLEMELREGEVALHLRKHRSATVAARYVDLAREIL